MISAIIIDDEAKGRLALKQKLAVYCPEVNILAEASDGQEAIAAVEKLRPQLIFLDIEMPVMNGFDMLNSIKEKNFHIIFTTAYDQYAIRAIKYSAFDYLLKPIDITELQEAVARAVIATNESTKQQSFQTTEQVELLNQNIRNPKKALKKLAIPTLEGLLFYDIHDIIRLEANSNYTNIHFVNKSRITASKTLKDFEELLPPDVFFRIHHSHLVNLDHIKKYIKGDGGAVEMNNGDHVDVSRARKTEFLATIGFN